MKENDLEDSTFKMPVGGTLEESLEESPIPTAVDELRLEKLNTRVTIISIMIPVLIVVVLLVTYLDIKKRVVETEDTGTMGVQKLSSDLESRFSSLSIRQARLEDETIRMAQNIDKTLTKIEVKMSALSDAVEGLKKSGASKSELKGKATEFANKIANLAGSLDEIKVQLDELPKALMAEMEKLQEAVNTGHVKMDDLEKQLAELDQNKMNKSAMELAMRLETMKIEQGLKAELDAMQTSIKGLDEKIRMLSQGTSKADQIPAKPNPLPSPPADQTSKGIIEQPLPQ